MKRLAHLTITSGHRSLIHRHELADGDMRHADELLVRALATARRPDLPGMPTPLTAPWDRYSIAVERFGGGLQVYLMVIDPADPATGAVDILGIFGIAPRTRDGRTLWPRLMAYPPAAIAPRGLAQPTAPWCAVLLFPALDDHRDIVPALGDLEAALAFAWMERDHD